LSYALTYTSEIKQYHSGDPARNILIEISEKDGLGGDTVLDCSHFSVRSSGNERADDTIITWTATLKFNSGLDETLTNETFLTDSYDRWLVVAKLAGKVVFTGFIEPSFGGYQFKSRPFEVEITCTDGLGLLKFQPITQVDLEEFYGLSPIIQFIAGALTKTNLDLPIRTICNIFEKTMNEDSDLFNQARLHHRTFMKSSSEFVSCYDVLEIILKGFMLSQWYGQWVISYRGELFETAGPTVDYCVYDKDGVFEDKFSDLLGPINVGKDELIHPVNFDHTITWQPSVRQVKTQYDYELPHNLVDNEKFIQLGDQLIPYEPGSYVLEGWSQYTGNFIDETTYTGQEPYVRVITNPYGFEMERYLRVQAHDPNSGSNILRNYVRNDNDDFWVDQGDTITINLEWRISAFLKSDIKYMMIALETFGPYPGGFLRMFLTKDGTWISTPTAAGYLAETDSINPAAGWVQSELKPFTIPKSGSLYIMLGPGNPTNYPTIAYEFKNLEITYNSFAKGDKKNTVKGDYYLTEQNIIVKDAIDEPIGISDSPRKIFKGAIFGSTGSVLTNPTWYRKDNFSENHHYKSLVNWALWKLNYRRMKRMSGSFRGTLCQSDNYEEEQYPLCFHKHFRMTNDSTYRMYVLTGPVEIDYIENQFKATFVEVKGPNRGGNPSGDLRQYKLIF
jgi:hypothetical protein